MKTKQILVLSNILAWFIFVALCAEAGIILVSSILWLALPDSADRLYVWRELTAVYEYDKGHFITLVGTISLVTILKTLLFYKIIKLMSDKNLRLSQPFSTSATRYILDGSIFAFFIGLLSKYGVSYAKWLSTKDLPVFTAADLKLEGANVWLLMSVVLFVIAQVFKRGIEIQQENDLTV